MQFEQFTPKEQEAIESFRKEIQKLVKPDLSNLEYVTRYNRVINVYIHCKENKFLTIGDHYQQEYVIPSAASAGNIAATLLRLNLISESNFEEKFNRCYTFVFNHNFFIPLPSKRRYRNQFKQSFIADIFP